jgi:hypothetical protein
MYGIVHAFADEKHKDTQGHRQEGLNDQYSVFDRKIHGIWEGVPMIRRIYQTTVGILPVGLSLHQTGHNISGNEC